MIMSTSFPYSSFFHVHPDCSFPTSYLLNNPLNSVSAAYAWHGCGALPLDHGKPTNGHNLQNYFALLQKLLNSNSSQISPVSWRSDPSILGF